MKKIITHNANFHMDDVASCAILTQIFPNAEIVRTRNITAEEFNDKDILILDVGTRLEPELNNYDHHQFRKPELLATDNPILQTSQAHRPNGVPYASFGLILKYFGEEYITKKYPELKPEEVTKMVERLDKNFAENIDYTDTTGNTPKFEDPGPGKINISAINISSLLAQFNPKNGKLEDYDKAFEQAVLFTKILIQNAEKHYIFDLREEKNIKLALEEYQKNPTGLLIFDKYTTWQSGVDLANRIFRGRNQEDNQIKYVIYPAPDNTWRVQQTQKTLTNPEGIQPFPKEWWGTNAENKETNQNISKTLTEKTGIYTQGPNHPEFIFAHTGGFILGTKTKEAAIQLAQESLAIGQPKTKEKNKTKNDPTIN